MNILLSLVMAGAVTGATPPQVAPRVSPPSTRDLARINWMEFRELVPSKIDTVLLPLGTLEAHGVTANGADILAPVAITTELATRVNALVAPVIPYGFTGGLDAYPGSFTIPEEVYRAYVRSTLQGLARNKFRNIVMVNGHGGGQTAILNALAQEVGRETNTRILVINWWSYCSDVTLEVFGEDGGHAGENENAFMMAIDPALVHKERYTPDLATANPSAGTWSAYPNPSSIGLYKEGQGYPKFDLPKAKIYFARVVDKVGRLIEETVRKWNLAGL